MPKVLRIMNRGECPRLMLELFGASNKREKLHDHRVIGLNGTGTKYAPAAAHRLGVRVIVTSTDEQGPYMAWYDTRPVTVGGALRQRIVMHYVNEGPMPLQVTTDIGRVWDQPIGADDKRTFRVVREFETNAADEDAHPIIDVIDDEAIALAPPGFTVTYLSWHDDFQEMLFDRAERWFKGRSGQPPLFAVPGIGAIYPKSDDDHTRVFCQGRIAYCVDHKSLRSAFDFSVDDKQLLSEDRELREASGLHATVNRLLCRLTDLMLAKRILKAAIEQPHGLEGMAIGHLQHLHVGEEIEASETWLRAWHELYDGPNGEEAVFSAGNEADQIAIHAFRKRPVTVQDRAARFLARCGVASAGAYLPSRDDYAKHEPNAEQLIRLGILTKAVHDEYGSRFDGESDTTYQKRLRFLARLRFYCFTPLNEKGRGYMGLTDLDAHGQPTGTIGINEYYLGSWTDFTDTALHELVHALLPTNGHGLDFVDYGDRDRGRMFREKHGIPHEPSLVAPHKAAG